MLCTGISLYCVVLYCTGIVQHDVVTSCIAIELGCAYLYCIGIVLDCVPCVI